MLGYCFYRKRLPAFCRIVCAVYHATFFDFVGGMSKACAVLWFKIEAGNVFHFAKLLKMKGIARSQKRLQIWGSFWLRNCGCWSLELIALGHIEFKQIDVEGKMLCNLDDAGAAWQAILWLLCSFRFQLLLEVQFWFVELRFGWKVRRRLAGSATRL